MDELEIQKELEFARIARDILESMHSMVAVDTNGDIIFIGRSMARRLNYDPQECIGKPVDKILPITKMKTMAQRIKTGEENPVQFTISPETGALRSRITIYRDGKKIPGNEVGVAAFDAMRGESEKEELIRTMELLAAQNAMYRSHLTQVYSADRNLDEILGVSPKVRAMKELIKKVAGSSASICIVGETGTGKELVANAIHKLSKRADNPFVKINCAAIPKNLMESELFGYEPGAFTGASKNGKLGKFELANGGTLLLDEIGEMPLELQSKLLRVLQSGEVERVGGTKPIPIDVRLICSTNRNLRRMVEDGNFRADLYYRVNTIEVEVPPLRSRFEDIPLLCTRFIVESNRKNGLSVTGISDGAIVEFNRYSWPGNIRELEHAIERACILCGEGVLRENHFPFLSTTDINGNTRSPSATSKQQDNPADSIPRKLRDEEAERRLIVETMAACGSRRLAAKQLGIARSTLYEKLKKYGLQ